MVRDPVKWLLILLVATSLSGAGPRVRDDLRRSAGSLICKHDKKLTDAWQLAIYDVLLAIKLVKTQNNLQRQALSYAQQTDNYGYIYGKCPPKGPTWLLTVSAPYRPQLAKGYLEFSAELSNYCRQFVAMYAPSGLSWPKILPINNRRVLLPKTGNGIVSLACQQPAKENGARLFYAVPIGKPATELVLAKKLVGTDKQAIVKWLTAVRKTLGLSALTLQEFDKTPVKRFTVHHNRQELARINQQLTKQKLLGENRVRAYSLPEALAMLWLSPFHRQLLVDRRAKYIDIAVSYRTGQVLVVMLVAS